MEAKQIQVELQGNSDDHSSGTLHYQEWNATEVQNRAFQRTLKAFGLGFATCFVILFIPFVHWSLIVLLPTLFVSTGILYKRFMSETANFSKVEGVCPNCGKTTQLGPFTHSKMQDQIKLICPECGQTCSANIQL